MLNQFIVSYSNTTKTVVNYQDIIDQMLNDFTDLRAEDIDINALIQLAINKGLMEIVGKGVYRFYKDKIKVLSCRTPYTYCIIESLMSYKKDTIYSEDLRKRIAKRYDIKIGCTRLQVLTSNQSRCFEKSGYVADYKGKKIVFRGRFTDEGLVSRTAQMLLDSFNSNSSKSFAELVDVVDKSGTSKDATKLVSYTLKKLIEIQRLKRVERGVYEKSESDKSRQSFCGHWRN